MDDTPQFDDSETKFGDIDKPIVANRPTKVSTHVKSTTKENRVFRVAAKIQNGLAIDCNAGSSLVKPKDFAVNVNNDAKNIQISANGEAKLCLHTIDEAWVRDILGNEVEQNYKITIKKNS